MTDYNIDFKDHRVQHPNRFKSVQVAPGIVDLIPTWIENPAEIIEEGTPVNADLFDKLRANVTRRSETFAATAGQTVFNLTKAYLVDQGRIDVYISGIKQRSGVDFTETSPTSFTLSEGLDAGTIVEAVYFSASQALSEDLIEQVQAAEAATIAANEATANAIDATEGALTANLNWKEPVNNLTALNALSNPQIRDTRQTRDTGDVYRYDGTAWVLIQTMDPNAINALDTRLTSQLADIAIDQKVRKYDHLQSQENYNVNFADIPDTNVTTLNKLKVINALSCSITDGLLSVGGKWNLGYNPLQLDINPAHKVLRFKLKQPSIYPTVFVRHNDDYSQRLSVWVGTGDKKIGIGVLGKTNTLIQEFAKSTFTVSTTEDFWLEIRCGLVEAGEAITVNYWTDAMTYTNKQTLTYSFISTDTLVKTGKITFGTQVDPILVQKLQLYDGLEYHNKLKDRYYFSGRWFGRWLNDKDTMTTINNGSAIYCKVKGTTRIFANFEFVPGVSAPIIGYSIDNGPLIKVSATSSITLATSLDPTKEYIVKILASSIFWKNGCWKQEKGLSFSGLTLDGGGVSEPYIPQNKRIMFFGNSITHGCNIFGTSETLLSNSAGEYAYPHIVSRELGALPLQVGYAGTGLTRSSSDGMPTMLTTIDYKSCSQLQNDERPDILVLNIGTNDYATDAATFKTLYRQLIDKFISRFGRLPIFICDGFTSRNFIAQMQELADEYDNCLYIDTSSVTLPTTDGVHPNEVGHENVGVFIAEFIRNNIKSMAQ